MPASCRLLDRTSIQYSPPAFAVPFGSCFPSCPSGFRIFRLPMGQRLLPRRRRTVVPLVAALVVPLAVLPLAKTGPLWTEGGGLGGGRDKHKRVALPEVMTLGPGPSCFRFGESLTFRFSGVDSSLDQCLKLFTGCFVLCEVFVSSSSRWGHVGQSFPDSLVTQHV